MFLVKHKLQTASAYYHVYSKCDHCNVKMVLLSGDCVYTILGSKDKQWEGKYGTGCPGNTAEFCLISCKFL